MRAGIAYILQTDVANRIIPIHSNDVKNIKSVWKPTKRGDESVQHPKILKFLNQGCAEVTFPNGSGSGSEKR